MAITTNRISQASKGLLFYQGKVCKRHPEEKGKRYVCNGDCVECQATRVARRRSWYININWSDIRSA